MKKNVQIQIRTHNGFREWMKAKKKGLITTQLFGRHQFIYKRGNREISLIEANFLKFGNGGEDEWVWEISCLKGDLFNGPKRFKGKQEAENYIMKLLHPEELL